MPDTAILKIYDYIGDEGISAKDVSDFLDKNSEATEIKVKINSPGGSVDDGWAIHDLLKNSGKKITTVIEGKCFSIATVIYLAGTVRQMFKNADGLIHNPFIPGDNLTGNYASNDLLSIAESMAAEEEKILNLYASETGTAKDKLAEYMKQDTMLSAEDMLNLGFATEIIEPVKAYAYINSNKFNMNEVEKKAFFEKLGGLLDSKLAKAFSRLPEVKNQELTDVAGNKLTLEKESGSPAVGDAASPDGTYVLENGDTVVVADGKVTSITPMAEDELAKAKAEIERLTAELATAQAKQTELDTAKAELETAKQNLETEKVEAVNLITQLRALQNSWKPEGRAKGEGGTNKVDGIDLNRVNELVKSQNK